MREAVFRLSLLIYNMYKSIKTKQIIFVFAIFSLFTQCSSKNTHINTANEGVHYAFIDSIHDFGVIQRNSPIASHDFRFVNTGTKPIVVLGVDVSCECTKADYVHDPVMPGDTSYIRVTYDGTGRGAEHFNKSVFVTTNAAGDPFELTFEGELR